MNEEKYLIKVAIIIICVAAIVFIGGFALWWLGEVSEIEMWEKMGGSTISAIAICIVIIIIGLLGYFAYRYYQDHSGR
jgi:heme/copper-type cytochrome/quinol oxidase subunit 2